MEQQQHDMNVAIAALKGAAIGIASAMEEESINSQEVYSLLKILADRMKMINNKVAISDEYL